MNRPTSRKHAWAKDPILPGGNSKFLKFMAWQEGVQSVLPNRSGDEHPLFPCLLPYPEAMSSLGSSVVDALDSETWSKRHVNGFIGWCNFIVLGCPDCEGWSTEPQAIFRGADDVRPLADALLGEVVEFSSLELISGRLTCKGGRAAVEEVFERLKCTGFGNYNLDGTTENLSGALEVVASRIAVPATAGTVDPCGLLQGDRRRVMENLQELRRPEHLWDSVVTACHRVAPQEEAGLVKKLLSCGMVELVAEKELPHDSSGNLLVGGLFCVKKNEEEDRLIFDRRPENATMERVHWSNLPAGACFSRMLLEPSEFLRGSGDDLRNYYYALRLPEGWVKYNAVGRQVDPDIIRQMGKDHTLPHRCCFRVLGMGDKNACDIGQAVHEAVLQSCGLLGEDTKLEYGKQAPRGSIWEGAYLDDLLITRRVDVGHVIPLDGTFEPPTALPQDEDMIRARIAEDAYKKAGLKRACHKSFRAEHNFKAWGAEIRGVEGKIGAPMEMRQQVWTLIFRVVALGRCAKKILQKILGYVCFIFQYRREMYSLMHHIYKFVDRMSSKQWVRLPGFIRDELRSIAIHVPWAFWNMRKPLGQTLLSTDATPTTGGAAVTEVSNSLAKELWLRSEVKGEAVRLDEDVFTEGLSWKEPAEPSVFASVLGHSLKWKSTASYHFRQTSHINLQECRALRREITRLACAPKTRRQIQICLNDSRVVCGAVAKGRSSSFKLNGVLRGMLPSLILGDITLALLWIETGANPADHPSRNVPIPPPSLKAEWLADYDMKVSSRGVGWELFAGTCRLTDAHKLEGVEMRDPVELLLGGDVMSDSVDLCIAMGLVDWIWLAPPCCSFSPLRNLDKGGPLRPKGNPAGDERKADVALGNLLWRRAIYLAEQCMDKGIYFFIEHPQNSKAWQMKETQRLWNRTGVYSVVLHWCMYDDGDRDGLPNKKPTRILSTAPWLKGLEKQCDHSHIHGRPLRGVRAKQAGAYPMGFCRELARACKSWW